MSVIVPYARVLRAHDTLHPPRCPPAGIRSSGNNVLLHGPPGTGKTTIAQAASREAGAAFYSVLPSSILSKYQGEESGHSSYVARCMPNNFTGADEVLQNPRDEFSPPFHCAFLDNSALCVARVPKPWQGRASGYSTSCSMTPREPNLALFSLMSWTLW